MGKPKSLKDQPVQNIGLDASMLGIFHYHVVLLTVIQEPANHFCLDHDPGLQVTSFINQELFWRSVQMNYLDKTTFLSLTRKDAFNTRQEKLGEKVQQLPGTGGTRPPAKPHLSPGLGDPGLEEQVQPTPVVLPRGLHGDEDILQLQALPGRAQAALPRRLRAARPGTRPAARLRPCAGQAAPPGLRGPARPGGGRGAAAGRGGGLPPRQQEQEEGGGADGQQEAGLAEPQAGAAHAAAPRAPAALRGRLMAPRPGGGSRRRRQPPRPAAGSARTPQAALTEACPGQRGPASAA